MLGTTTGWSDPLALRPGLLVRPAGDTWHEIASVLHQGGRTLVQCTDGHMILRDTEGGGQLETMTPRQVDRLVRRSGRRMRWQLHRIVRSAH